MIILDFDLPDLGGIELLSRLRQTSRAPILMLSMHTEPAYLTRALGAGAQGYVSKTASPAELLRAIRDVARGGRYVEHEIVETTIETSDRW